MDLGDVLICMHRLKVWVQKLPHWCFLDLWVKLCETLCSFSSDAWVSFEFQILCTLRNDERECTKCLNLFSIVSLPHLTDMHFVSWRSMGDQGLEVLWFSTEWITHIFGTDRQLEIKSGDFSNKQIKKIYYTKITKLLHGVLMMRQHYQTTKLKILTQL